MPHDFDNIKVFISYLMFCEKNSVPSKAVLFYFLNRMIPFIILCTKLWQIGLDTGIVSSQQSTTYVIFRQGCVSLVGRALSLIEIRNDTHKKKEELVWERNFSSSCLLDRYNWRMLPGSLASLVEWLEKDFVFWYFWVVHSLLVASYRCQFFCWPVSHGCISLLLFFGAPHSLLTSLIRNPRGFSSLVVFCCWPLRNLSCFSSVHFLPPCFYLISVRILFKRNP